MRLILPFPVSIVTIAQGYAPVHRSLPAVQKEDFHGIIVASCSRPGAVPILVLKFSLQDMSGTPILPQDDRKQRTSPVKSGRIAMSKKKAAQKKKPPTEGKHAVGTQVRVKPGI